MYCNNLHRNLYIKILQTCGWIYCTAASVPKYQTHLLEHMNLQVAGGGVVILWCSYMTIVIWHDKYLVMWHKTLWQQHDHDQAQLWSPHYRLHNCKYFNVDTLGFNVYCQHCYLTGAGTLRIIYDLNVVILVRVSPISSLVHEKTESHVLHSTANLFIHLPPLICLPGAWCWNKLRIVTHLPPQFFNKELGASHRNYSSPIWCL